MMRNDFASRDLLIGKPGARPFKVTSSLGGSCVLEWPRKELQRFHLMYFAAAFLSFAAASVRSQVKPGPVLPKCPWRAVSL